MMYLEELTLINFKNIKEAKLGFLPGLNCFVGDNGAGKTNVLDAIHYLSVCKSAFNLTDGQCAYHSSDFFVAEGSYLMGESQRETIYCGFKRGGGKVVKRSGKEYEKLSEHIGLIPVVLVSPADTSLINESGEERRKFINSVISQIDRGYLNTLIRYNHLLGERNKLLKQPYASGYGELMEVLDMQLSEYGKAIHRRRAEFVEEISDAVAKYYAALSDKGEEVSLRYRSELSDGDFSDLLAASREKDRVMQHTTCGPHRDDIAMNISGHLLRKFGSQGQQKSFLVALKIAQFEILNRNCGFKPILLLDDIFDKLDIGRVERLIKLVSEKRFGQIFITDSNKVRLETILDGTREDYRMFTVDNGDINPIQQL